MVSNFQEIWEKWVKAVCDCKVPTKLKGKLYFIAIQLFSGTDGKCWVFKGITGIKASVALVRMLKWMCGHTKKEMIKNVYIQGDIGVTLAKVVCTHTKKTTGSTSEESRLVLWKGGENIGRS